MSIIFQLFSAEDLKQLTSDQYDILKDLIVTEAENSKDVVVRASLTIARHVQSRLVEAPQSPIQPRTPSTPSSIPSPASPPPPSSVDIDIPAGTPIHPATLAALEKRVNVVFQQLTGKRPVGSPSATKLPPSNIEALLKELLSQVDIDVVLTNRVGKHGLKILASALTCELVNSMTYEELKRIKNMADTEYMNLTGGQRPKGPDLLYSPFHPLSPLYPARPGQNP